jgi:signal transduction histidine kinase
VRLQAPHLSSRTRDHALAAVATVLQVLVITTGDAGRPAAAAGTALTALGLAQGLLLFVPRHRPGLVAAAICLGYAGQAALVGVLLPAAPWVALVQLSARTRRARAVGPDLALLAVGWAAGAWSRPASAGSIPLLAAVTASLVLAGAVVSARRANAEALAGQRAEAEQQHRTQERLVLARELHDSIGHGLSTIAVQSSAARMALDAGQEDRARQSLAAVESSSRAAMREMRDLLSVLRARDAELQPAAGVAELPAVVDRVRESGVAARLTVSAGVDQLSTGTQATVYRIVQEGLTNVVRHAWGGWAEAEVSVEGDQVIVSVQDGGARQESPAGVLDHGGGSGLAGLRERVQLVGGTLEAGPIADHGGWRLTARLPATGQEAT